MENHKVADYAALLQRQCVYFYHWRLQDLLLAQCVYLHVLRPLRGSYRFHGHRALPAQRNQ